MRKVMTEKQRRKRFNDIKIVVYYMIAKFAQFMTGAEIIMCLISAAADIEFTPVSTIILYLLISIIVIAVSNFIASKLSFYLYRKHAIPRSKVIDSIFTE